MCTRCPLSDAITAAVRMLDLRGSGPWLPVGPEVAGLPRIAALLSPHARECHAAECILRAADASALVVVTDIDRLTVGMVKHAADPDALAAALGSTETPTPTPPRRPDGPPEIELVAAAVPNTQTLKMFPANASVLPWTLALTYPLDHEIVPPHRRATAADLCDAGLARCKPSVLPAIHSDDPVVRYLRLRVGEIVRIDRPDGSLYFRRVVAPPSTA